MKMKSPYKYERIRFYNAAEGKHQYIILAKIGGKIVKHRFEK